MVTTAVKQVSLGRPRGFGARHFQALLMFTGLTFSYFLRVNMSSAIVLMIKTDGHDQFDHYLWDPTIKSLVLSSFFWGYVLAQIPMGLLATKFGPKIILTLAHMFCAIFTLCLPYGATLGGYILVCILRVLVGFCQGAIYPCVHTLLSSWAPRSERGLLSTFVYSGAQIGTVIMLGISGTLSKSFMGWPGIFYFSGTANILYAIIYSIFGSNSPAECRNISMTEKMYVENLTGRTHGKNFEVPWKSILTSKPFLALICAHCAFNWGFYTLLTEIPSYIHGALGLDIQNNSVLASTPYITMWALSLVFSPVADLLINRNIIHITLNRKIFNTIGTWIPAAALVGLAYVQPDKSEIAVTLLVVAVGFNSASYLGYLVNHMDLSPNYAGTMMGISNAVSNLTSIFAPLIVGKIVSDESDVGQWRIVFLFTSSVYFFGNLLFVIFGSGKIQPWN